MSAEIIYCFLVMRNQLKIYHWQTHSFSRHKASDELIDKIDDNIDSFVEVYIGKYGRPIFKSKTATLKLDNFDDKQAPQFVQRAIKWLSETLPKRLDSKKDTDLLNIRDEMLANLNQTLYLFELH